MLEARDIYDYGNLWTVELKAININLPLNGASANWHWDAKNRGKTPEYAWYVHEGKAPIRVARPLRIDISDAKFSFRRPMSA
jgi:hypothetical protein